MKKSNQKKHTMMIFALGLFSLGAFCLSIIMFIKDPTIASAGALPLGISTLMLIISIYLYIKQPDGGGKPRVDHRVLLMITGLSLYILLTYLIGFYPSTAIFAVYSVVVLGERPTIRLFSFSIGLVLVLWILFGTIFRVTLP
ncbi:tripartite tricarboxylate transporter TctB family protein [Gudongella oleilytica]|jgi:hypothetical protein|uniref:tripartite tricarboxylate transporter TctB family protein n=1 Tax=Gudongella oleilytica TaxID=1582259 RepID=UPI002A35B84D|nr:tripartite tricarboxylate transporter TctB family protein [Gudongella oleilytica]MDY0256132.1 tripartite tricarboxylate transporter TctB family protein [Gudongella oleilytica]